MSQSGWTSQSQVVNLDDVRLESEPVTATWLALARDRGSHGLVMPFVLFIHF